MLKKSGRIISNLCQRLLVKSSVKDLNNRKYTTLISMVRNEKNIIESFCSHALALFDNVIVIDHLSTDGTRGYITQLSKMYPKFSCYYFDDPGRYQADLMTWASKNLIDKNKLGWVFFLDADEFLPFKTKFEFDSFLYKHDFFSAIKLPWLNLIPIDWNSGKINGGTFLKPPKHSPYKKIAFQHHRINNKLYKVSEGNHSISIDSFFLRRLLAINAFPIYHFPIRTKDQILKKLIISIESLKSKGYDRKPLESKHFDNMYEIVNNEGLTEEIMNAFVEKYGEDLTQPFERSFSDLIEDGYSEINIDIALDDLDVKFKDFLSSYQDDSGSDKLIFNEYLINDVDRLNRVIIFDKEDRTMHLV